MTSIYVNANPYPGQDVFKKSSLAVVAATAIDYIIVDNVFSVMWMLTASLDSDPSRRKSIIIHAQHNGKPTADATATEWNPSWDLLSGADFSVTIDVDVSGAGSTQQMRLMVAAAAATTFKATRINTEL